VYFLLRAQLFHVSAEDIFHIMVLMPKFCNIVVTLSLSSWNFVELTLDSGFLRLHGDLIYIDVATLEGNKYCITGSSKSFYVNSSNKNIFDSKPTKQGLEASTLVGLLQKISAKFKKGLLLSTLLI
jgi:hypothetical protein